MARRAQAALKQVRRRDVLVVLVLAVLTRGGPLMATPRAWETGVRRGNSFGAKTSWNLRASLDRDALGGEASRVSGRLAIRPAERIELSVTPSYAREIDSRQYITRGRYPGIGEPARGRSSELTVSSLDSTSTPSLIRDSTGAYTRKDANGFRRDIGNPDFDVLSFRSNLGLRWEWRPGRGARCTSCGSRAASPATRAARWWGPGYCGTACRRWATSSWR